MLLTSVRSINKPKIVHATPARVTVRAKAAPDQGGASKSESSGNSQGMFGGAASSTSSSHPRLVAFEPWADAHSALSRVESIQGLSASFARHRFSDDVEMMVNRQVNIEYSIATVYFALYAFFDRDNVGLPGFASYFYDSFQEELSHAKRLTAYVNTRGGKVRICQAIEPQAEWDHPEKGEALHAMECALALEQLNFDYLTRVYTTADEHQDRNLCDLLDSMLEEQAIDIKKAAVLVSELRRVGRGLGVFEVDRRLAEGSIPDTTAVGGGSGAGGLDGVANGGN